MVFIYKGQVNIEQKNLSALLRAAETLQIRGLSGGDIFANESYRKLVESEETMDGADLLEASVREEAPNPKKRRKTSKNQQNNSILEKALTPGPSTHSETSCEALLSEQNTKDSDCLMQEPVNSPVYHRLEMKVYSSTKLFFQIVVIKLYSFSAG